MAFPKHYAHTAAALAEFDAGNATLSGVHLAYYKDKRGLLPMPNVQQLDLEALRRAVAEDGAKPSIAFQHGAQAAWRGEKLATSALRSLHPDSHQYHDFIAGYDSKPNWYEVNMKSIAK